MILPAACMLLGISALWLALRDFRDFRNRRGDFSDWIVPDATNVNRRLWRANASVQMVVLVLVALLGIGAGLSLMLKN